MKKFLILLGFTSLFTAAQLTDTPESIRAKGDKITQESAKTLSGEVMRAVQKGGVANGINYCNIAAYPLTDSLAKVHKVSIKRTALRYRNPRNKPTARERKWLKAYEKAAKEGKTLEPLVVKLRNGDWLYTRPILLQPQCQVCHGEVGKQIDASAYALIKQHYPHDKAINFAPNDVRGMWVLRFKGK